MQRVFDHPFGHFEPDDIGWILDLDSVAASHGIKRVVDISDRVSTGRLGLATPRSAALPIMLAVILAAGFAVQASTFINHDVAYTLYTSGQILDGSKLYQDILDVNPPLVWFQALPSVAVARAIDISEITAYRIYICALIAISLFLANVVLRRLLEDEPAETRRALLVAMALLLVLWGPDFGQREHIMTILVMPYILRIAAVARGRTLAWPAAVAIGLCAGVGVALKPYFILLPVALELYLMASGRRWAAWFRPDALTLGAVIAAYVALVAVFAPEYFTHMLPIGLEVYWAYNNEPAKVITAVALMAAFPLLIIVLMSRGGHRPVPQLQWAFGAAGTALAVACVIQSKGWSYHIYPTFVVLAAWALFLVAVRLAGNGGDSRSSHWARFGPVALGATALLIPIYTTLSLYPALIFGPGNYVRPVDTWVALIDDHAANDSIFAFSSSIMPTFPAVNYSQAEWASRSCCLWMLPAVMRMRAAELGTTDIGTPEAEARLDEIEAYQRELVIEDLTQRRPALVFVEIGARKQAFSGVEFDYLEYFMSDPRFVSLWSEYEELTVIPNYRVFKRLTPDAGDAASSGR